MSARGLKYVLLRAIATATRAAEPPSVDDCVEAATGAVSIAIATAVMIARSCTRRTPQQLMLRSSFWAAAT
ncbi:MAG TPA: hypothetical protein VHK24_14445 [Steroidobacter sp.]|nr:hypothetical protein [Steroidobacter sp.]